MPRPPKHWAYTALKNPDLLVKHADSLPEAIRDVPTQRKRIVAALIAEHGGPGRITVKEALLIDRIGRLWPYLELIDRAAFDAGKPDVRPADYTALHNALTRTVQALAKIADEKRAGTEIIDVGRYLGEKASVTQPKGRHKADEKAGDRESDVHEVSEGNAT
jgi:hypothetical protein